MCDLSENHKHKGYVVSWWLKSKAITQLLHWLIISHQIFWAPPPELLCCCLPQHIVRLDYLQCLLQLLGPSLIISHWDLGGLTLRWQSRKKSEPHSKIVTNIETPRGIGTTVAMASWTGRQVPLCYWLALLTVAQICNRDLFIPHKLNYPPPRPQVANGKDVK